MLYLDYAKPVEGGYILNFFADKVEDMEAITGGKEFVTKNGTNYGVPLKGSTVVITAPDKEKKTFILDENGEWNEGGLNPNEFYTKEAADEKFMEKVVNINLSPDTATQGTLTEEQLATLMKDDNNYITLNKEIYRLADKQYTTEIISYVNTGVGSNIIYITVSTRAWTLVVGERPSTVYKHELTLVDKDNQHIEISLINNWKFEYDDQNLRELVGGGTYSTVGRSDISFDGSELGLYNFFNIDGATVDGYAYYIKTDGTIGIQELSTVRVDSDWVTDF